MLRRTALVVPIPTSVGRREPPAKCSVRTARMRAVLLSHRANAATSAHRPDLTCVIAAAIRCARSAERARRQSRVFVGYAMLVDVEPEEREPTRLLGWHVVEIGMRQAWPFLTFADPQSGRESRLYIDSPISVTPGWHELDQDDAAILPALASVNMATVVGARVSGGALELTFDQVVLRVEGQANRLTTHSPWWFGNVAS